MRIDLKGEKNMKLVLEEYDYSLGIKMLCMLSKKPDDVEGNIAYRMMSDGRCFCRSFVVVPNGFIYDLVTSAIKDEEFSSSIKDWFNRVVENVQEQRNSNIPKQE